MKKIDLTAISVMIIAALLIVCVILVGNQVPLTVHCQLSESCAQVGPFGSVLFEFSRPVVAEQVEKLWQTTPMIDGKLMWVDGRHVRWISLQPLPSGQIITLQFVPGQAGQNGEKISTTYQWEVTVRAPLILGIGNMGDGQELFAFGVESGLSETQLTHSEGRVFDFSPSPDGETVAFSAMNALTGIDLWVVNRDGSGQRVLLDCGADRCSTPAWSPASTELAYTREGAGLEPNGPKGAPRTWILDINSEQTAPLFADPQNIGYGPNWSPNGEWLSIWDGLDGGIEVVNRETGETFLLESSNGDAGCWSPDSKFLYYADMVSGEAGFRNVVYRADIDNGAVSTILGGNVEGGGLSVNNPVCNLKDKWIAVTIQTDVRTPGAELVMLNPDSKDGISIVDDLSRIPSFYSWTPDGDRLVYQSYVLGAMESEVEIWVWDRKTGKANKVKAGYRSPNWLP